MNAQEPSLPEDLKPFCKLSGEDGNAYAVMGRATRALEEAIRAEDDAKRRQALTNALAWYCRNRTRGDYDHLLRCTMAVVRDQVNNFDGECPDCGEYLGECDCY